MRASRTVTPEQQAAEDAGRRLGAAGPRRYTVKCRSCGHVEPLGSYAVAQLSMGHDLTYTCTECGTVRPVYVRAFKLGTP